MNSSSLKLLRRPIAIISLMLQIKTCFSIQSLHHALMKDNIPSSSTQCDDGALTSITQFEFNTTNLLPSDIHVSNAQYEFTHVFLMEMKTSDVDGNFTIRIARGGNIYSYLNSEQQELIAPQSRVDGPYNDEVWQTALTDTAKHDPDGGDDMIIHQAGPYRRISEESTLIEPWMSPEVSPEPIKDVPEPLLAIDCSVHNQCTFASWGQQSDLPTPFTSSLLLFQRYANCGNGILEHTTSIYNMPGTSQSENENEEEYNDDEISFLSNPWFGVRPSVLSDVITTHPTTYEMSVAAHNPSWIDAIPMNLDDTAGFTVLSETVRLRNPTYTGIPCGTTNNDGTIVDCSSTNAVPLHLKLRQLHDYTQDACGYFGHYSNLYNTTTYMCRLDSDVPLQIDDGTYDNNGSKSKLLQLVVDDPNVTGDGGTDEESFFVLDLHPLRGIIHWSFYNSNIDAYYIIFAPNNSSITTPEINTMFQSGMALEVTETPTYELPCAYSNGTEANDCSHPESIGRPNLILKPWYSGASHSCQNFTHLSTIYNHTVAYCRLENTIELKNNLGSKYEHFTLHTQQGGTTYDLTVYGVLHWAYKNPATGAFYLIFFVGPDLDDGTSGLDHVKEILKPGETLTVYRNHVGKVWNENNALSLIHGNSITLNEQSRIKPSIMRVGMTGSPIRDFMPLSIASFPNITPGEYLSKRQYVINDKLSYIKTKSLNWVNETTQYELSNGEIFPTNIPSYNVTLFSNGSTTATTFGGCLSTDDCSQSSASESCVGSTVPLTSQHFAHFAISCGTNHHYIGTNRYHFSPIALQLDGTLRPWLCMDLDSSNITHPVYIDNNITLRPKYTFLGFFHQGSCNGLQGMKYDANLCNPST